LRYSGLETLDLPLPALPGPHQFGNAGLAVAVAEILGLAPQAMAAGLARAEWPARLQRLVRGPLVQALPAGIALYLDGGHNEAAGEALAGWIGDRRIDLVFGMLSTKDPAAFLRHVAGRVRRLRAISIVGEPLSRPAAEIADAAIRVGVPDVAVAADENAAVADLAAGSDPTVPVLVCGSLYLCGRVLAANG
jgi:dihydrofolate synthase/folylpolyglutamate synthase